MTLNEYISLVKGNARKDARFLVNTLAIALLVLALMFAFQPYLGNDPKIAEVQKVDHSQITVHPGELKNLVQSKTGKPVMLVFYASWCGYCKLLMPTLVNLVRDHQLDDIDTVFISVDEQPRLLSKYLVHQGYDGAFTPYRLERDMLHGTMDMFTGATGSHYTGTIPYVGFFNRDGKLITDAAGVLDKQDILNVAHRAQNF